MGVKETDELLAGIPGPRQRELVARVTDVLWDDARFLAAWLGGSLARGNADIYSDVDVRAIVDDAAYAGALGDLDAIVERFGPAVLRRLRRASDEAIMTVVAPDWARYDLVVQPLSAVDRIAHHPTVVLFDRADLAARIGRAVVRPIVSPSQLAFLAEEFLRVLGLLPVVLGRGEHLVGMDGVMLLRRHLVDLLLIENGVTDRGGVLRLNPFLTAEQRALLESLPPLLPTREPVVGGHVACARAFIPRARALLASHGIPFPNELERATFDHLRAALGIEIW